MTEGASLNSKVSFLQVSSRNQDNTERLPMKIVFPDETVLVKSPKDLNPLTSVGMCVVHESNPTNKSELIERIKDAEIIVICLSKITADVMDACPRLKHICFLGVGVDTYIDSAEATKRGIWVTNTRGYGNNVVAEHAFGLLLCLTRKIVQGDRELHHNIWEQKNLEGTELDGKNLGIIGLGSIGTRMAHLGNSIGMNVLCYTRSPDAKRARKNRVTFLDLETLLKNSDFVSLHIAATEQTYHLIDRPQFQMMKKTSLLINTARGELVNTEALCDALKTRQIAGAGLDNFEKEPLPKDHPLLQYDNVVVTPHIAWNSSEASKRILDIAIKNILSFSKAIPMNLVNKEIIKSP